MAKDLKKELAARLAGAEKLAVLAIGSELRRDDGAGILVAEELLKKLKKPQAP